MRAEDVGAPREEGGGLPRVPGPGLRRPRITSLTASAADETLRLQESRLVIYVGVMCALWAAIVVITPIAQWVLGMTQPAPWSTTPQGLVQIAMTIVLGIAWVAFRRAWVPPRWLRAAEAAVTLCQPVAAAALILFSTPAERSELLVLLGVVHLLMLRAALIPSHPGRTAVIGVLACAPVLIAGQTMFARGQPSLPSPSARFTTLLVWSLFSVGVSMVTSRIIYGLRRRVREAMSMGQYTLEDKIGQGGMGVVYRARHALLRRPTAIKLLPAERMGEEALARFEREVQMTASLSHPNIVSVYDFGRSPDGVFYYAMEFLDGVDLERLIKTDGPQPPGRVLAILRQAAEALAEAHAVRLIHRDIKPANIILTRRASEADVVKVVDFGLVREVRTRGSVEITDSRTIHGTPLYMAPESALAPETVDARSDLYALGAVGYFLLTGSPVFEGTNPIALVAQHVQAEPVPPSRRANGVPPKLEEVILRCLEKKPERRFASARDLLLHIDACDDVPAWSRADAAAWWARREPAKVDGPRGGPVLPTTLAVDLSNRAAPMEAGRFQPDRLAGGAPGPGPSPTISSPPGTGGEARGPGA